MRPFLITLQFLTRLPVRLGAAPEPAELGRSLLFYPLVGLLIGAILASLAYLLPSTAGPARAALVLCAWIGITGGLHLDGLADSADAWAGGMGDREKSLAIMKDPRCGPMAVSTVTALLILKFAALDTLIPRQEWMALWLAPVTGRGTTLLLFLGTPYVRAGGIGALMAERLPRGAAGWVLCGVAACAMLGAGGKSPLLFAYLAAVFWLTRRLMMERIGGATGDTAGALIELTETASLLAFL
jgi:adenosylcobinamide-GDP ribazoletransferase